jgi:hypothetical protein
VVRGAPKSSLELEALRQQSVKRRRIDAAGEGRKYAEVDSRQVLSRYSGRVDEVGTMKRRPTQRESSAGDVEIGTASVHFFRGTAHSRVVRTAARKRI